MSMSQLLTLPCAVKLNVLHLLLVEGMPVSYSQPNACRSQQTHVADFVTHDNEASLCVPDFVFSFSS